MPEQDSSAPAEAAAAAWDIATVKQQVQDQCGDQWLGDASWTPFVIEMAWFLHESSLPDQVVVRTLLRLVVGGFTNKPLLKSIGNEKEEFARLLGLPSLVSAFLLFDKYVVPHRNKTAHACTIKLKYKKSTFDWVTYSSEESLTLVALADVARRVFSIEVAKLEFIHSGLVIHEDADVAGLQNGSLVQVENKQVPFSSVKNIEQALRLVGFKSQSLCEDDAAFPQAVTLDESDDNVKHAVETIARLKTLVPIVGGCEATRRLYIDPILCAAGLNVGDITMTVEKTVEDSQFNGDVDYLCSFEEVVICVTEGKKDQLDHGIAQNIAQLSSVRANRKRKIDEISKPATFGIATTFIEWVFIKYEDERVLRSKPFLVSPESSESITDIIGRVTGLLWQCKSDAGGGQPPASRQKSEVSEQ